MKSWTITRYILLGLFAAASLGATAYEWWYIWPMQKCEQAHDWWDPQDHQCLSPMPIWRITGRLPQPPGVKPSAPAPKG